MWPRWGVRAVATMATMATTATATTPYEVREEEAGRRWPPLPRSHRHPHQMAVRRLNELQSNAHVLDALRRSGAAMNERSLPEMRTYIGRLGYSVRPLRAYKPVCRSAYVHVRFSLCVGPSMWG
jgi:hypothetical protein